MGQEARDVRRLPVVRVLSHSLRSAWNHFGYALRLSWPWMLALLPFNVASNAYLAIFSPPDPLEFQPDLVAVEAGQWLLTAVAFSSIAVNWHRYMLFGEVARGWNRLRLDGLVWRYFGNSLVVLLPLVVGLGLPLLLAYFAFVGMGNAALMLGAAGLIYSYRLGIKLPAVAAGRRYTFGEVLTDTRHNLWPFFYLGLVVSIVTVGIALAIGGLAYLAAPGPDAALGAEINLPVLVALFVANIVLSWIGTVWTVTLLTSLYRFYGERIDL